MENDNDFVVAAIQQIAKELRWDKIFGKLDGWKFSDFAGVMYNAETSAQSAILMRAATLKEFVKEFGYVRLA